jgi:hypothetical protein
MTSATGTFTSCGPGQFFSLQFDCTGPSCTSLDGFPRTTCTTNGNTLSCTNGVECSGPTNYTSSFTFTQEDIVVSQRQEIVVSNCESFVLTSDGTTGGTSVDIIKDTCSNSSSKSSVPYSNHTTTAKSSSTDIKIVQTATLISNTTVCPGATGLAGGSTASGIYSSPGLYGNATSVSTQGSTPYFTPQPSILTGSAFRRSTYRPGFLCLLLLVVALFTHGTAASSFHEDNALQLREIPSDFEAADFNATKLNLAKRALPELFSKFADLFGEYLAGKLTTATSPEGGELFADNLIGEVEEAVCDHLVGGALSTALIPELVETCVTAVYTGNALVAPELEFLSVLGATVLCNYAVNEAFPGIGELTDAVCKDKKPCGDLLTDPNNCGSCGNVVSFCF